MRRTLVGLLTALLFVFGASMHSRNAAQEGAAREPAAETTLNLRPIPPELLRRFQALHDALQPSARSWVEQQARIESKRPTHDVNEIEAAIRQRFAASLPKSGARQPGVSAALGAEDNDVAEMAVLVILMMVQDGDKDLQEQMQQAQAQVAAKQQLRALLNELNQESAAMKGSSRNAVCVSAVCRSLPDKLTAINAATARLPHPSHLIAPATVDTQAILNLVSAVQNDLDADNEISEMGTMQLQMLMDARSKLLQTASDLEKSVSDTNMAIIQNLK